MSEQKNKEKPRYVRFLIPVSSIRWENEKQYLIQFEPNKAFLYPKALAWKQVINYEGDHLFKAVPHDSKEGDYLQLSFKEKAEPYTDKNGKTHTFTSVEVRTKIAGQLDKDGNQKFNATKISLWDLREHFAEESKAIVEKAKLEKQLKSQNNNSQVLTLN